MMKDKARTGIFALIGGILFAVFDRCGYMLKTYGSIWAVSENLWHRNIWMRILCRVPVSVLLVLLCFLLAERFRKNDRGEELNEKKYFFAFLWAIYFISFLPAFLGGYPGIFAADAPNQIGWTFSGRLTAHHPILHTGILCSIFSIARVLGLSDNTAAAVCSLIQMAVLSGIFAWISHFLKKENAPVWLQIGTVLFLCLFPFHAMMSVYTTKDVIFSGIFVLCLMQVWQMCARPEAYFQGYRFLLRGGSTFLLLFLFRNNGFHTLLLCAPFLFFYLRKYWKKLLILFAGLLLCYQCYNGPFQQIIGAEPGNSREMYSIMMQTLGRTYMTGGDIRPEEMDVIRPVMDEETLAMYTPNLSDPIKNYFDTEAFYAAKGQFLKTWMTVGLRNTKIYIDAFLHTTAAFWYPDTEEKYLKFECIDIMKEDANYPHVRMTPVNQTFYKYYTAVGTDAAFRQIPVLRELLSMGFYFWLMVFAALYVIYRREYHRLLWMLPMWTYMATSFFGPTALLRYSYPIMLAAPVVLFFMMKRE